MKFSVLIPTKDRLDLLKYAVKSILRQTYRDFEIIISDNCSIQDVKSWVGDIADDRIIYFHQNSPVSVTGNWNTANDLASGDYIIMLGDDDALLPDSLQTLYEYIQAYHSPQLIEFPAYLYLQPDVDPAEKEGNVQSSPLLFGNRAALVALEERQKRVRECFQFNYTFGFNMQYFCYSRELVTKLKQYGNFYEPPYPDYYTACMMMLAADTVLHIPQRITVIGITRRSYGYYFRNNIEKEGMKFHKEADYRDYAPERIRDKLCSVDEIHTAAIATFSLIPMRIQFDQPDLTAYYKQVILRELSYNSLSEVFQLIKVEILPHLSYKDKIDILEYTLKTKLNLDSSTEAFEPVSEIKLSYPNILMVIEQLEYIDRTLSIPKKIRVEQPEQQLYNGLNKICVDALRQNISKREVLIWGAYDRGRKFKEFLDAHDIKLAGFIDKNPNIRDYLGLPVWPPEYIHDKVNEYYIMIPLRTVVPSIVELLESESYRYMMDYFYIGYDDYTIKRLRKCYSDLHNNKIIAESDDISFSAAFYGYDCELHVTDSFKTDSRLLITLYGDGLKMYFNEDVKADGKDLMQIKVEFGSNTEQEPTVEIIDNTKETIKFPSGDGYTLIFNSDKLMAVIENIH